ncbi:MAG: hypothetical protein KY467_09435 [Gemmatimonadetes bacterium]|nr:hypothetical protein [Gemmatimonadota bacterium]
MRDRTSRPLGLIAWPFSSPLTSPVWLVLRIYLASIWMQFGVAKLRGGWLRGDALEALLQAVADGQTPAPFSFYPPVAQVLVATGMDVVLCILIPLAEVAVASAFLTGVMLVPAAVCAILLNLNLILAGVASVHFDGRIIALQLLLLAAWRVAGYLGLGTRAGWRGWDRRRGPVPGAT